MLFLYVVRQAYVSKVCACVDSYLERLRAATIVLLETVGLLTLEGREGSFVG